MWKDKTTLDIKTKIVIDFETTGLYPYDGSRPFIVGMEDENGTIKLAEYKKKNWDLFEYIIQNNKIEKICHNAKFEIKMTKHLGLTPSGIFHDTQALTVLVNEYQPLNLGDLSIKHFKDFSKDMVKVWIRDNNRTLQKEYNRALTYKDVPSKLLKKYLVGDLDKTMKLFWLFFPYIKRNEKLYKLYNMEISLAHIVVDMEDSGVRIDIPKCFEYIKKYKQKQIELEKNIFKTIGKEINLNSNKQLGAEIRKLGLNTKETEKGGISTAYEELIPYKDSHPFVFQYLQWKTMDKMLSTYLIPFIQKNNEGIIHPNFWQYGKDKAIVTGRFSATDPSFHTIPARSKGGIENLDDIIASVKNVIIPDSDEVFIFFDFKQIEMRIFAHYINDHNLIKRILSGEDVYRALACILYGDKKMDLLKKTNQHEHDRLRDIAKQTALSLIYGMGVSKFATRLSIPKKEALQIKRDFFNAMPSAKPWIMSVEKELYTKGYIEDIFGKRYHVPLELCYKGVNAKCQGTAAKVMKDTILKSVELKKYGAKPFLTLHDELGLKVPIECFDVVAIEGKKLFEDFTTFRVPLTVDVEYCDKNWGDKKKYIFK